MTILGILATVTKLVKAPLRLKYHFSLQQGKIIDHSKGNKLITKQTNKQTETVGLCIYMVYESLSTGEKKMKANTPIKSINHQKRLYSFPVFQIRRFILVTQIHFRGS